MRPYLKMRVLEQMNAKNGAGGVQYLVISFAIHLRLSAIDFMSSVSISDGFNLSRSWIIAGVSSFVTDLWRTFDAREVASIQVHRRSQPQGFSEQSRNRRYFN